MIRVVGGGYPDKSLGTLSENQVMYHASTPAFSAVKLKDTKLLLAPGFL